MSEYPRKMVEVISSNYHREQDVGKQPVLDVRNLASTLAVLLPWTALT